MIRLAEPLPDYMHSIAIGAQDAEGAVRISGFGLHEEGGKPSANALRHAMLIGKPAQAGETAVILATGAGVNGALTGVGACEGDSGGPMVLESSQQLVGIIASGIPLAGRLNHCGGYTAAIRLSDHLPWINASADALRRIPMPPAVAEQPR
jgi:hypothetical protein